MIPENSAHGGVPPAGRAAEDELVDFGFERIPAAERDRRVRAVFDSVAPHYDLMNDLMSVGIHRLWKAAMVNWLAPRPDVAYLDVAGGTGDIAFRILDRLEKTTKGPGRAHVTVLDPNERMLAVGSARAARRSLSPRLAWVVGTARHLPFRDRSLSACTIAFGLRNVTGIEAALKEILRVLRPGGRFLCLEFSRVTVPILDRLYDRYSFNVLPALGGFVTGDREAYRYLVESIRRFPAQDALAGMMARAGFALVRYRNLSGGIVAVHSGWRI
jgi:demethylmenaquinone methyltransferase/2-methoxy-6-polyprenyl-1,4-benzoquinol methylase